MVTFLPALMGEVSPLHDTLFYYDTRNLVGVRHQHWKYYRRYTTENAAFWPLRQGPFLFDLDTDPNESYSLIEPQPERAAKLEEIFDAFKAEIAANLRGWL